MLYAWLGGAGTLLATVIALMVYRSKANTLQGELAAVKSDSIDQLNQCKATITEYAAEIKRLNLVNEQQSTALDDARKRLEADLGPEGARQWLKDLLSKP